MRKFLLSSVISLALVFPALAATVSLTWTNPTTRSDGSPITGSLTTQIFDSVTAPGLPPSVAQIGTGPSPFKTGQLANGSHAFTVVNCEVGAACSGNSNIFTEVIVPVIPNAVTDLTGTIGP